LQAVRGDAVGVRGGITVTGEGGGPASVGEQRRGERGYQVADALTLAEAAEKQDVRGAAGGGGGRGGLDTVGDDDNPGGGDAEVMHQAGAPGGADDEDGVGLVQGGAQEGSRGGGQAVVEIEEIGAVEVEDHGQAEAAGEDAEDGFAHGAAAGGHVDVRAQGLAGGPAVQECCDAAGEVEGRGDAAAGAPGVDHANGDGGGVGDPDVDDGAEQGADAAGDVGEAAAGEDQDVFAGVGGHC
jgi:hypothetical protein